MRTFLAGSRSLAPSPRSVLLHDMDEGRIVCRSRTSLQIGAMSGIILTRFVRAPSPSENLLRGLVRAEGGGRTQLVTRSVVLSFHSAPTTPTRTLNHTSSGHMHQGVVGVRRADDALKTARDDPLPRLPSCA